METAALPKKIRETMFLFNQRLLLTKTRCHRLDRDRNCPLCQQEPETDEHLMINCQLRHQLWSWLEGTVRQLGCRAIPDEIIRGNIGPTENLRTIFTLVAAYIFTTWKERCYQRNPTEVEVKKPWASLRPSELNCFYIKMFYFFVFLFAVFNHCHLQYLYIFLFVLLVHLFIYFHVVCQHCVPLFCILVLFCFCQYFVCTQQN